MPGPQEQRLIQALQGGDGGRAFDQSRGWGDIQILLRDVAEALDTVDPPTHGGEAGALTAAAMKAAFSKSASAMRKRTDHIARGKQALAEAGAAIEVADADFQALGSEGSAPSYTPHEDPGSEAGIKQRNDYLSALQAFQAEQAKREEAARKAVDRLEDRLNQAADVMAGLHDQPRGGGDGPGGGSYPPGSASGGAGGGGTRGGGVSGSAYVIGAHATFDEHGTGNGGRGGEGRDPGGPRIDYVPGDPSPNAGGTPATISASGGAVSGVASGSGGGLDLGPAGVVAGGAAAGVIGAKLSGALRGVLAGGAGSAGAAGAAGAAGRGTAASAVRGIGATAKSAGASTLGRGAAAAARPGATAPGAAGRSGAAGARGGAAAGSGTGRAGSRAGAGAGAGAGRGGRRGTDDDGLDHERFDVGEDWVGDDDAAPGVLS